MTTNQRLTAFLESSFLSELLQVPTVTDISFNGEALYYEDSALGRQKYEKEIANSAVGDFLRQIANFSDKQFSYMNPILDVSFSRYRLNATFLSIVRVKDERAYSFSLRIGKEGSAILDDDTEFWGGSRPILMDAIHQRKSIVIAGETGAGKTELQKYLLMHLPPATRVIVIDNVEELEMSRSSSHLDLTSWLVDDRIKDASFPSLIRNALRNNPDYLLVAESRGAEMLDALNCVMSGHPIMTTLHAKDIYSVPQRIARMALMANDKLVFDEVLTDVYHHFSLVVYLKKVFRDGRVVRYLDEVGEMEESTRSIRMLSSRKGDLL